MPEEQTASQPAPAPEPPPPAVAVRPANPVRRLTLIVIAISTVLFLYGIIADSVTPYSSQGLMQAYLVRIAPEVGGRVIEVGVGTDQRVEAGTVLFRLDPDQYTLAVNRAEAQLETIGQSIGASTSAVATAQAKVVEAIAKRENVREQTARIFELVKKGIYPEARRTQAKAALDSAEAIVVQAESELEKARQTLGPAGNANPQIRDAIAVIAQANLDLQRATVRAPTEGGVTSLALAVGQVLAKGEAAMTFIDVREVWIEAAFREMSLDSIKIGDKVEIVLDLFPGRIFSGRVSAVGYGVGNRDVDARTGLPAPRKQSGWIRPSQLMPVRIEFDRESRPTGLRIGSQASVMVYPSKNFVMNALGSVRMWLASLMAYVQ